MGCAVIWRLLLTALPMSMGPAQKKHRSRSCYFFSCGLLCLPLKPALRRKFPGHAAQVATMHPGDHGFAVAKFSAFEGHCAEQKQTIFLTCCCSILLARSQPREWRSDLQLFLRQTNLQPQKQLQCILKKVQAQEKEKNLTTLNLQEQLHLLTWATASWPMHLLVLLPSERNKAWEETAVSNSKSQKIPCPTQRHFGESKAKTSERWTCRAGETLGQGSSPIASVTLGLSLALAAKRKLFPLFLVFVLWNLLFVHGFSYWGGFC